MRVSDNILNPVHEIRILVIGAGGTGSNVINNLAKTNATLKALEHPGIHVLLLDGDKVEKHNIGRQMFSVSDVGYYKSDILVERINRYFSLGWDSSSAMLNSDNKHYISNFDIVISCVDNVNTREMIKEVVDDKEVKDIAWLDFGNTKDRGQAILGMKVEGNKEFDDVLDMFPDMLGHEQEDESPTCSTLESLNKQDLFINSILAQFGCDIIYKLIRYGFLEQKGCFVNLSNYSVVGVEC